MKETVINELERPDMKNIVFIEGLPGIGLIGKLAAEHLIQETDAKKFAELYSPHFPHQALVKEDATLRLMKNKFYHGTIGDIDLVILVGDTQPSPSNSYGHYEIVTKILEYLMPFGISRIFTLGGYSTGGEVVEKPRVLGAVSHADLVEEYKDSGITFRDDPGAAIVGASGLLLAMGRQTEIRGVCLLGESPGYMYIDAKAAKSVLEVLSSILGITIDMTALEERAEETENLIKKIQDMQRKSMAQNVPEMSKDLGYIR
ncbi:MAG: proteasome assembly chaperone family protein [Candidatus Methanofastidiosa archaeon]|nr:proteasome assembly chaperone family protein [Candidatus Methanofastidiosa archaeon]